MEEKKWLTSEKYFTKNNRIFPPQAIRGRLADWLQERKEKSKEEESEKEEKRKELLL